jgi:hypothetical protein
LLARRHCLLCSPCFLDSHVVAHVIIRPQRRVLGLGRPPKGRHKEATAVVAVREEPHASLE